MNNAFMSMATVYIYCLYHFTGFCKIIHVWIFIKMYPYLLVYFFILSANLNLIHLIDPLPSVFISLFKIIILEMGAWLEGCFKEQSRSNLHIHSYIFINPRSHMTIQDAKTVSDKIEKGGKEKLINKINNYLN